MGTAHISAEIGDIAKTVLMPGDPKRAEFIAKTYLNNVKLVTDVRGILGYTGEYKGQKISTMASGMGMPSMGIYCYELYKFYNVENIIRVGTCGVHVDGINLLDLILVDKTYTEGNFALAFDNNDVHMAEASDSINGVIEETANKISTKYTKGSMLCADFFDVYVKDFSKWLERLPKDTNVLGSEMENFSLFYTAKALQKNAASILTVVDSKHIKEQISREDREKSLSKMIELALESGIKL